MTVNNNLYSGPSIALQTEANKLSAEVLANGGKSDSQIQQDIATLDANIKTALTTNTQMSPQEISMLTTLDAALQPGASINSIPEAVSQFDGDVESLQYTIQDLGEGFECLDQLPNPNTLMLALMVALITDAGTQIEDNQKDIAQRAVTELKDALNAASSDLSAAQKQMLTSIGNDIVQGLQGLEQVVSAVKTGAHETSAGIKENTLKSRNREIDEEQEGAEKGADDAQRNINKNEGEISRQHKKIAGNETKQEQLFDENKKDFNRIIEHRKETGNDTPNTVGPDVDQPMDSEEQTFFNKISERTKEKDNLGNKNKVMEEDISGREKNAVDLKRNYEDLKLDSNDVARKNSGEKFDNELSLKNIERDGRKFQAQKEAVNALTTMLSSMAKVVIQVGNFSGYDTYNAAVFRAQEDNVKAGGTVDSSSVDALNNLISTARGIIDAIVTANIQKAHNWTNVG